MPYLKYTFITGKVIEIEKKHTIKYRAKSKTRSAKKLTTSESQKIINENNAIKKLRRIINANFGYRDFHITLGYEVSQRPADREAAIKDMDNFIKRLRNVFKKASKVLKYVFACEYGINSIHHHIIIPNIEPELIQKIWSKGRIHITPLDKTGQYEQLASYIIKQTRKTFNNQERQLFKKRFCSSTNLIRPEPIIEVVTADSWKEDPIPEKGYVITRCRSGVDDFTGYPYQSYVMVQIMDLFPEVKSVEVPKKKRKRRNKKHYAPIASTALF